MLTVSPLPGILDVLPVKPDARGGGDFAPIIARLIGPDITTDCISLPGTGEMLPVTMPVVAAPTKLASFMPSPLDDGPDVPPAILVVPGSPSLVETESPVPQVPSPAATPVPATLVPPPLRFAPPDAPAADRPPPPTLAAPLAGAGEDPRAPSGPGRAALLASAATTLPPIRHGPVVTASVAIPVPPDTPLRAEAPSRPVAADRKSAVAGPIADDAEDMPTPPVSLTTVPVSVPADVGLAAPVLPDVAPVTIVPIVAPPVADTPMPVAAPAPVAAPTTARRVSAEPLAAPSIAPPPAGRATGSARARVPEPAPPAVATATDHAELHAVGLSASLPPAALPTTVEAVLPQTNRSAERRAPDAPAIQPPAVEPALVDAAAPLRAAPPWRDGTRPALDTPSAMDRSPAPSITVPPAAAPPSVASRTIADARIASDAQVIAPAPSQPTVPTVPARAPAAVAPPLGERAAAPIPAAAADPVRATPPAEPRPIDVMASPRDHDVPGATARTTSAARADASPATPPVIAQAAAPVILPALQAFGAAIRRAMADERKPAASTDDTILGLTAPAATTAAAPAQTIAASDTTLDTADRRWPHAMAAQIEKLRDAADSQSTRIRLLPDALGPVDVAVRRDGEQVHVHFTAADAQTRQLLADAQPRLADAAEARGLKLGRTDVSGGDLTGGDRQQQRPAAQQQQASRPAPARTRAATADTDDSRLA